MWSLHVKYDIILSLRCEFNKQIMHLVTESVLFLEDTWTWVSNQSFCSMSWILRETPRTTSSYILYIHYNKVCIVIRTERMHKATKVHPLKHCCANILLLLCKNLIEYENTHLKKAPYLLTANDIPQNRNYMYQSAVAMLTLDFFKTLFSRASEHTDLYM